MMFRLRGCVAQTTVLSCTCLTKACPCARRLLACFDACSGVGTRQRSSILASLEVVFFLGPAPICLSSHQVPTPRSLLRDCTQCSPPKRAAAALQSRQARYAGASRKLTNRTEMQPHVKATFSEQASLGESFLDPGT